MPTNLNQLLILFYVAVFLAAVALFVNIQCLFSIECITHLDKHIGPKLCLVLAILIILRRVEITLKLERRKKMLANKLRAHIEYTEKAFLGVRDENES